MVSSRQPEMKRCKYCRALVQDLYFECCSCEEYVHLKCCKKKETPGGLLGDIFFIYTCPDCSPGGNEVFERAKMAWVDVVMLILYNLTHQRDQSKVVVFFGDGYYHRDKHIKKFLIEHWSAIFPHMRSKRKTWRQMLYETLKKFPQYFRASLSTNKGEGYSKSPVWYKMARPNFLPNQPQLDREQDRKFKKVTEQWVREEQTSESETMGYDSSSHDGEASTSVKGSSLAQNQLSVMSLNTDNNMYSRSYVKPSPRLSEFLFAGDEESCVPGDEDIDIEAVDMDAAVDLKTDNALAINIKPETPAPEYDTSETVSVNTESLSDEEMEVETPPPSSRRLLVTNLHSTLLPWLSSPPAPTSRCIPMNLGEETYELSKLSHRVQSTELMSVAELRLHRKLVVRKLRRERGIPVFDPDVFSREGGAQAVAAARTVVLAPHVLDRFHRRTVVSDPVGVEQTFWTRLMGHTEQYSCFTSPMTKRVLKAFIRRDLETKPLWLRLCAEIRERGGGVKEPPSPIIYSYVRPHHIPAVNSLAQHFFWPGINLSECLHYPDFSCVVLYKKLVVGFAFIVPDVGFNEAYISFVFTRPEWRRAGIASFMLYHLIQTCMGKDITLHVSATNPALLLYQKFGFKVEEFIQDFYDKYLPAESSDCRHALCLRLAR